MGPVKFHSKPVCLQVSVDKSNKHIDQHRHGIQTLKWFDGFSLSVVMVTNNENLNILQKFFF